MPWKENCKFKYENSAHTVLIKYYAINSYLFILRNLSPPLPSLYFANDIPFVVDWALKSNIYVSLTSYLADYQTMHRWMASLLFGVSDKRLIYCIVFDGSRDIWLEYVHWAKSETLRWRAAVKGYLSHKCGIIVSSTSMSHLPEDTCKGRSFTSMENKRGPETDPCGPPNMTYLISFVLFTFKRDNLAALHE